MRIEEIYIKGFGKINNLEIEFGRGFNIVFGANESGKSTIQAFIKAMFYSLKGGRSLKGEVYAPLKKYRPWIGKEYKGSLRYVLDNGQAFKVERNFENGETRVYDFLYKDITKTFDQSKDKGPLFAIRHIGLTEACFEKTLYIGQMATKIDTSKSKDLIDSLSNIYETGSEDVSYLSTCEAIKEAMKRNVGTDKTSTRPLDIINKRLDELNTKRESLLEVKGSLFSVEEEIAVLNNEISKLEEGKTVIQFAKEIVKLREELETYKRNKKDLNDIIIELYQFSKVYDDLRKSISKYEEIKEHLASFSKFGFNDVDDLYINYTKYENLEDKNTKILAEIEELKKSVGQTEVLLEGYRAFDIYKDINLSDTEPSSEFNLERNRNSEIQVEISKFRSKRIAIISIIAALCILLSVLFYYYFLNKNPICLIGVLALVVIFFMMVVLRSINNKKLISLKEKKDESDSKVEILLAKVENQKLKQAEMFKMLEIDNIDEFLKKKVLYESKVYELKGQKERIIELESELEKNCYEIKEISKSIKEKLIAAKIINSIEVEVKKEQIEEFRCAVNKFRETEPYLRNAEDKLNSINKQIENLNNRAYSISGQKVSNNEELTEILCDLEKKIEKLYENLDIYAYKIKTIYPEDEIDSITYDTLMETILDLSIEETKQQMEKFTQNIYDRLSEKQLMLKQKEMMFTLLNDENDELEKLEEDIRDLEVSKEKLEEIGFSLKTALEVLEEANNEIKRDFAPVLNNNVSKIVRSITDCRYEELKVDENFVLRTTDPYLKDIVPISVLSGGTVDQMYLALRIALVQTIEKKSEKLPLIIDEILSQYDDARSLDTIRLLNEISRERQIIFFTCKSREIEMAEFVCNNNINIIELK